MLLRLRRRVRPSRTDIARMLASPARNRRWSHLVTAPPARPVPDALDAALDSATEAGRERVRLAVAEFGLAFFDSDLRWLKHYGFGVLEQPSLAGGLTR